MNQCSVQNICIDDAEDDEGDVRRGSASSFVFQEWFFSSMNGLALTETNEKPMD